MAVRCDIVDPQGHEIAATQFTFDGEIEEREVPRTAIELQPRSDRPDLALPNWRFRAD
jgi:hypothetical protein